MSAPLHTHGDAAVGMATVTGMDGEDVDAPEPSYAACGKPECVAPLGISLGFPEMLNTELPVDVTMPPPGVYLRARETDVYGNPVHGYS